MEPPTRGALLGTPPCTRTQYSTARTHHTGVGSSTHSGGYVTMTCVTYGNYSSMVMSSWRANDIEVLQGWDKGGGRRFVARRKNSGCDRLQKKSLLTPLKIDPKSATWRAYGWLRIDRNERVGDAWSLSAPTSTEAVAPEGEATSENEAPATWPTSQDQARATRRRVRSARRITCRDRLGRSGSARQRDRQGDRKDDRARRVDARHDARRAHAGADDHQPGGAAQVVPRCRRHDGRDRAAQGKATRGDRWASRTDARATTP